MRAIDGGSRDLLTWLAQPRVVAGLLILYCAIHFGIRLALSPNYSLDEAEQVLFGESLQWGYRFRHPPLITWLTWATMAATGGSRVGFFLMKYAIMAAGLVAYLAAARIVIKDNVLAAVATLALLTTFTMGWMPHDDLMHTVLLAAMLAAFLWAAARVLTTGTATDYVLLGIVMGLGTLSKYVFVIMVAGFAVGVVLTPHFRRRIKVWSLVGALLLACAIAAPYAHWAWIGDNSLLVLTEDITKASGPAFDPFGWLKGGARLAVALIVFCIPAILLFPVFYRPALREQEAADDTDRAWLRVYAITMILGAIMMLSAVFIGTYAFKIRWMHQVAMPLFIWFFLRVRIAGVTDRANRTFATIALTFAGFLMLGRFLVYETSVRTCIACREYWPLPAYASGLQQAGFTRGTIISITHDVGGNLRPYFSDSRIVTPGYPVSVFGPPVVGPCVLVWMVGDKPLPGKLTKLFDYAARVYRLELGADAMPGVVDAPLLKSSNRPGRMNYILVPPSSCPGAQP